ncbi:hypothetical protein NVP1101O_217 [Vibrio phage 1.101.O._10N.261.45.C6]|nr:hypothetical protein NVP1101O_217 [Vibrio phage 1.101.O._10N.261.45.C6]
MKDMKLVNVECKICHQTCKHIKTFKIWADNTKQVGQFVKTKCAWHGLQKALIRSNSQEGNN